jgi:4-hydroxybenzoyl-CoA thioesterase
MNFPFTVTRRILWGDSDPAGIVYTPRIFYFAIETVEEWLIEILGHNWKSLQDNFKIDTPTVKMSCEFFHPLRTGENVNIILKVKKLGGASIHYTVDGSNSDNYHCFRVEQIACFVDSKSFKPIPILPEFRKKIKFYQDSCSKICKKEGID